MSSGTWCNRRKAKGLSANSTCILLLLQQLLRTVWMLLCYNVMYLHYWSYWSYWPNGQTRNFLTRILTLLSCKLEQSSSQFWLILYNFSSWIQWYNVDRDHVGGNNLWQVGVRPCQTARGTTPPRERYAAAKPLIAGRWHFHCGL